MNLLSQRPLSACALAVLLTAGLSFTGLAPSAHAALLEWDGNYVSGDTNFRVGEGGTALAWDANQHLDPTTGDYPGTGSSTLAGPAFYGAHEVNFSAGVEMNEWQIDNLSPDDAFAFQLRRNSGTGDDSTNNAYGLFILFKAADINPAGINVDQIQITATNVLDRNPNPEMRALVWDNNGDFYVSNDTLTLGSSATLTVANTDTFMTFDEMAPATGVGTGTPGTINFNDVMGMGFYIGQDGVGDLSTGNANRAQFQVNSVIIEGAVIPEPGTLALMAIGMVGLVGSTIRRSRSRSC